MDPPCAVNDDWGSLSDLRRGGAKFEVTHLIMPSISLIVKKSSSSRLEYRFIHNHNNQKKYSHFFVFIDSCHERQSFLTRIVQRTTKAAIINVKPNNIRALEHLFTPTASTFCECKKKLAFSKFTNKICKSDDTYLLVTYSFKIPHSIFQAQVPVYSLGSK